MIDNQTDLDLQRLKRLGRGSAGLGAKLTATMMIAAFVSGFSLVYTWTAANRSPATVPPTVAPISEKPHSEVSAAAPGLSDTAGDEESGQIDEADAPPEVPPGRTPDGVLISGVAYFKCWDADGVQYKGDACGTVDLLERRFSSRLYVVDKCKREFGSAAGEGLLSLGMNVDLPKREVSFWAGPSSDLEGAKAIGSCVRRGLVGLPLGDINAKYDKYRIFFSVTFDDPGKLAKKIAKLKRRGKKRKVVMDHVRVRREPVDGFVFGKLGSDTEVLLIGRKDDWCRIITPSDNEGWMTCDALGR